MKKKMLIGLLITTLVFGSIVAVLSFCGNVATDNTGFGPAPSSGDGVSEGSGFDRNDWPNEDSPAKGLAPNSGDGIPDGSGF